MHLAFLSPESPSDQPLFVRALKRVGARVSGIGNIPRRYLPRALSSLLDDYERVASVEDGVAVVEAARRLDRRHALDRVEAVHEKQVLAAALAREALRLPGVSAELAELSRDKWRMKSTLGAQGVLCAPCEAAETLGEARKAAEILGFPLVLKPRRGYGALETFRLDGPAELERVLERPLPRGGVVLERFLEGEEGFLDTLTVAGTAELVFLASYDPPVLRALGPETFAARVVTEPGVDRQQYDEVRALAEKVSDLLDLGTLATHLEFLRTEEGLFFSEIGLRPPGERLWELHALGNDLDLHLEWALAVVEGKTEHRASGRFAAGSVQVRPECQGRIAGYGGLAGIWRDFGRFVVSSQVLTLGYPTTPAEAGYLGNCWFRLFHPKRARLAAMLREIGERLDIRVARDEASCSPR